MMLGNMGVEIVEIKTGSEEGQSGEGKENENDWEAVCICVCSLVWRILIKINLNICNGSGFKVWCKWYLQVSHWVN